LFTAFLPLIFSEKQLESLKADTEREMSKIMQHSYETILKHKQKMALFSARRKEEKKIVFCKAERNIDLYVAARRKAHKHKRKNANQSLFAAF
jgi:hypothetical protein